MKFDKNTAIGFTLMILLLLGFSWYQANEQEKLRQSQQAALESAAAVIPSEPAPVSEQPIVAAIGDSIQSEQKAVCFPRPNCSMDIKIMQPRKTFDCGVRLFLR